MLIWLFYDCLIFLFAFLNSFLFPEQECRYKEGNDHENANKFKCLKVLLEDEYVKNERVGKGHLLEHRNESLTFTLYSSDVCEEADKAE